MQSKKVTALPGAPIPNKMRVAAYKRRKKIGQHLVTIRISDSEIEALRTMGYLDEGLGSGLMTALETLLSDLLIR